MLSALDVTDVLDKGSALRYAIVLVPLAALVWVGMSQHSPYIRRMTFPDRILLVLGLVGAAGATYGVVSLGTATTMRPVFLPMFIGVLYLGFAEPPTEDEAARLLRSIGVVAVIYLALNVLVNSEVIPGLVVYRHFRNSDVLYVSMAVSFAVILNRRWLLLGLLVLALLSFKTYPSLTSVLVAGGTVATLYVMQPTARHARGYILAVVAIGLTLLPFLALGGTLSASRSYYELVGKTDNASFRLTRLWQPAILRFEESPWVGSLFSGEATVPVRSYNGSVTRYPFHNDYLLFLAEGGVLGLGALVIWLVATEVLVLRRYRGFVRAGQTSHAQMLRLILVGFNAFFVSAAFNPNFQGTATSATIFSLYGLMMILGRPPEAVALEPARDSAVATARRGNPRSLPIR